MVSITKFKSVKTDLFDYLFCFLVLSLPFSLSIPNGLLITLFLFFILDIKELKNIDFLILKSYPIIFLYCFLIYFMGKDVVCKQLIENHHTLVLPIILIPILALKVKNFDRIFLSFILLGLFLVIRASYGIILYYSSTKQILPVEGELINSILMTERPYLGFVSVVSIISAIYLAEVYNSIKWILYFFCFSLIVFIVLISARISSITIFILILLNLIFYNRISLKTQVFFLLLFTSFGIMIITSNQNLKERLFIDRSVEESTSKFMRHEPRAIIWPCAFNISKSAEFNVLFGINSEQKIDSLFMNCYKEKIINVDRANFFINAKLNSHSQFIATYLGGGIIGILLLSVFFLSNLVIYRRNKIKSMLILSMLLFFAVENVLQRQLGVYLFSLLISIVIFHRTTKEKV